MVRNILYCQALIALLLVGPATASILQWNHGAQPSIETRQNTPLDYCQISCELGSCGGLCSAVKKSKRDSLSINNDFLGVANESAWANGSLKKRVFHFDVNSPLYDRGNPSTSEVKKYLLDVEDGLENAYFGGPLTVVTSNPATEAAVSQEKLFGDQPFQILSRGVQGCQVIVIISNRAVWMTHLWETYSNGKILVKDEDGNDVWTHGKDTLDDPAFDDRVLKFLKGVEVTNPAMNERSGYIQPVGPGITADYYENRLDNTIAYIFTPIPDDETASSQNLLYENRVTKLIVPTLTGILNVRKPKVIVVPYERVSFDEEDELDTTQRGKVLFQFDPNSDNKGRRAWRLFMENRYQLSGPLPSP